MPPEVLLSPSQRIYNPRRVLRQREATIPRQRRPPPLLHVPLPLVGSEAKGKARQRQRQRARAFRLRKFHAAAESQSRILTPLEALHLSHWIGLQYMDLSRDVIQAGLPWCHGLIRTHLRRLTAMVRAPRRQRVRSRAGNALDLSVRVTGSSRRKEETTGLCVSAARWPKSCVLAEKMEESVSGAPAATVVLPSRLCALQPASLSLFSKVARLCLLSTPSIH